MYNLHSGRSRFAMPGVMHAVSRGVLAAGGAVAEKELCYT